MKTAISILFGLSLLIASALASESTILVLPGEIAHLPTITITFQNTTYTVETHYQNGSADKIDLDANPTDIAQVAYRMLVWHKARYGFAMDSGESVVSTLEDGVRILMVFTTKEGI